MTRPCTNITCKRSSRTDDIANNFNVMTIIVADGRCVDIIQHSNKLNDKSSDQSTLPKIHALLMYHDNFSNVMWITNAEHSYRWDNGCMIVTYACCR